MQNEEFLHGLDREMKKTLQKKYRFTKKWISYSKLLHQYFDFNRFLEESRMESDNEATNNLMKLAKQSQMQKLSKQSVSSSSVNISPKKKQKLSKTLYSALGT